MSGRGRGRGRGGGRGRGADDRRGRASGHASSGQGGRGGGGRGRGRGGGGRGRGGGGRGGFSQPIQAAKAQSNVIRATPTAFFRFYKYGVSSNVDNRRRRRELFERGIKLALNVTFDPKWMFFEGSLLFTSRPIMGLEEAKLPKVLISGGGGADTKEVKGEVGDYMSVENCVCLGAPEDVVRVNAPRPNQDYLAVELRCATCNSTFNDHVALMQHCTDSGHSPVTEFEASVIPSSHSEFLMYCNILLQNAMKKRMMKWGNAYIDPNTFRDEEEIRIFDAYVCEFSLIRDQVKNPGKLCLGLTLDVQVKLQRTKSLLDMIKEEFPSPSEKNKKLVQKKFSGQCVIYTIDKRTFDIVEIDFQHSAATLPVEGLGISHAQYFEEKKKTKLLYPEVKIMVKVLGRNKQAIYLPPELICCNELDPRVKMKLPMIASFTPDKRNKCIENVKQILRPGSSKKGKGEVLPSLGIILDDSRVECPVRMLPIPDIKAAGIAIPKSKASFWAPFLGKCDYRVSDKSSITLMTIVVHPTNLSPQKALSFIKKEVNRQNSSYRLGREVMVPHNGKTDDHWQKVQKFLVKNPNIKNAFVLDLTKPRGSSLDPAYSTVKAMLGEKGMLSQFVNFNTCDHNGGYNEKKSSQILCGVSRQILAKCGVRIWWVSIPKEIPLPAVFIGIDVFHAPRSFDLATKKRTAKKSCAACVVQIVRSHSSNNDKVEIYTETMAREAGKEINLGAFIRSVTSTALKLLKVDPKSCVVWRDGVGDAQVKAVAVDEIPKIKEALSGLKPGQSATKKNIPISYIICQVSRAHIQRPQYIIKVSVDFVKQC